jgi:hypothetical protein
MGKSARTSNLAKAERIRGVNARKQLDALAEIVEKIFGSQKECIAASALFVATATHLGYTAAPREVSMVANSDDHTVITGRVADEFAVSRGQDALPLDQRGEDWDVWGGHIVVSVKGRPAYVYDPTFGQFAANRFPGLAIRAAVLTDEPPERFWEMSSRDVYIRYILVDESNCWRDQYEADLRCFDSLSRKISDHIRSGGRAPASQLDFAGI